ncbi:epoxide hydrolase [Ophiocordyceps camponoti-floridani]|uniref:Epoxide hydrolase n=1 Tax=Ophiocordyceps camponoti-floridani TaxID=2030778 RepID=A0A8H4Q1J2_9HYPO|nr:epoxide hydrolase [Ophiocordyceps camponoti-floridani]
MQTDKLLPNDPRVRREKATIRGKTYSYIVGEAPDKRPVDTIFLFHGFPDLGFGWRYQVPFLMRLGLRVVVPDMLGYAGTDCPSDLGQFSRKSISDDVKELAGLLVGDGPIILGGHDWGGLLVWRIAMWHPKLVKAVFSVCTPLLSIPRTHYVSLEEHLANGVLTNFKYQLQFKGPDLEAAIQGREKLRQLFSAIYGGCNGNGHSGFTTSEGFLLDKLPDIGSPPLLSEDELDYYVGQYMLQDAPQLRGPLNWYRLAEIDFEEEMPLADHKPVFRMPTLFIAASRDLALPPSMSANMEQYMPDLTRVEVQATHWALTEAPDAVNRHLGEWLSRVLRLEARSVL